MKTVALDITKLAEAPCSRASDPDVFFPKFQEDLEDRKWDEYCGSCVIKQLCADSAYEGFVGIAGGEYVGKLTRSPNRPKVRHKRTATAAPTLHKALGTVIRQKRLEQKITLRALAAKAFVSASLLSDAERGIKEVSSSALAEICRALGCKTSAVVRSAAIELELQEIAAGQHD